MPITSIQHITDSSCVVHIEHAGETFAVRYVLDTSPPCGVIQALEGSEHLWKLGYVPYAEVGSLVTRLLQVQRAFSGLEDAIHRDE